MQFLVAMEFSIINVAIPDLQQDFNVGPALSHWVVTGYAVGFAALLFLGGRASERWGARRLIILGLAGFTAFSLLATLTWSLEVLITARVVQGASAAFLAPAALALLTRLTAPGEQPKWLGIWGASASVGFAGGVVFGGLFVEFLDWRSVFALCTALAAALCAGAVRSLPRPAKLGARVDIVGAALLALASVSFVATLSLLGHESTRGPWLLGLAAVALTAFLILWLQQQRTLHPLVPAGLIRRRAVRRAAFLSAAAPSAGGAMVYFASVYMQDALGWSQFMSGLALLPDAIAAACGAYAAPLLLRRLGPTVAAITGFAAMAFGLATLALTASGNAVQVLQVVVGTSLAGFGLVLCGVVATIVGSRSLRRGEHGASAGLLTASQQWGVAAGLAIGAFAVQLSSSVQAGFIAGGVIALTGGVAVAAIKVLPYVRSR